MAIQELPGNVLPISADSHLMEPSDLWTRYIELAYRDRAPYRRGEGESERLVFPEREIIVSPSSAMRSAQLRHQAEGWQNTGGWDPAQRLQDQDIDGIGAEVLYPTIGLSLLAVEDVPFQKALTAAYNTWLADFCADAPDRLIGLALICVDDIEWSVQELERTRKLGLHAAGSRRRESTAGLPPVRRLVSSILGTSHAVQESLTEMLVGGIFGRHPALKVISAENDITWLPSYMERLAHDFPKMRKFVVQDVEYPYPLAPIDYFRQNVYATFEDEVAGVQIRHHIGIDKLMWASDYPHEDSTWPDSRAVLAQNLAGVPAEEAALIARKNVLSVYNL